MQERRIAAAERSRDYDCNCCWAETSDPNVELVVRTTLIDVGIMRVAVQTRQGGKVRQIQ